MSAGELKEGEKAPDFDLVSSNGKKVSLRDLKGKTVVLYFYPKDDTPGCTREACGFRDMKKEYDKEGAVVLGISLDNLDSHKKFVEKYHLTFPLLWDDKAKVSKLYGVYKQKSMYGRTFWGIERTTFVIGPEGQILKIYPKVKPDGHEKDVLQFLKAI